VSRLDTYCGILINKEVVLWRKKKKKRDRKQKDEDNCFSWLTIRNVRIILIKIMDKANYMNTIWVV
jgi:hypothetical protein